MGKNLVIVESPAKAKTISKYLGPDFRVEASMGHVRDLPANRLGVDTDEGFEPQYTVLPSKKKVINQLKNAARDVDAVFLAPDPDREGEAICWHLKETVVPENADCHRVMFNEITKKAVKAAVEHPGQLNMHLVHAQQARRILDRLVGYKISPILWTKVKRGISAGRVQSVALRMIVDRERVIMAFKPVEYWLFQADLMGDVAPGFQAKLMKWKGEALQTGNKEAKTRIGDQEQADRVEQHLKRQPFILTRVQKKSKTQNPPPPFTTSKLQQEASRSLSFTVQHTMRIAQRLYEGKEVEGEASGLITYMRTDSTRVSDEAIDSVRSYIQDHFDSTYLPETHREFKQGDHVQGAHEAIRPTRVELSPEAAAPYLDRDELRLYTLIWKRFVASQMAARLADETTLEIQAGDGQFESRGLVVRFPGFQVLYKDTSQASTDKNAAGNVLPDLQEGATLQLNALLKEQQFTKPPGRFTEAALVKALEENGIGRPSTYASIIATLQNRTYAEKMEGRFKPTGLGMLVCELLEHAFPDLMDIHYTARLEDFLDQVERGQLTWQGMLHDFFEAFKPHLEKAENHMPNMNRQGLETDIRCEQCGAPYVIKNGKYGPFLSCSNYPDCTAAKRIRDLTPEDTHMPLLWAMMGPKTETIPTDKNCPECESPLVIKNGKFGAFTACSNYPNCTYIHRETTGVACPKEGCEGEIVVKKTKRGKPFYGCSEYPRCDFVSWDRPAGSPCPLCHAPTLFIKTRKSGDTLYCAEKECDYSRELEKNNDMD